MEPSDREAPRRGAVFRRYCKSIKVLSFVLLIVSVAALAILCSCDAIANQGKIKVTDLCGREVVLDKPAEKIVALAPTDCEILADINAKDKIIARGTYCNYPESIKEIKDVGSGEFTNIEEIVALQPDLVMTSKAGFSVDQINKLESAGLKVLVNEANTFEDIYKYITICGKVTGHETDAEGTISGMRTAILEIKGYASENQPKTIYFQICDPQYGY